MSEENVMPCTSMRQQRGLPQTAPHVLGTDHTDYQDTLQYLSHTDTGAKYPRGAAAGGRQPNAQELHHPRTKLSLGLLAVLLEQN